MTDLRKAAEMALDFIGRLKFADAEPEPDLVMKALRQALAQPEQSKYSDILSDGGLDPRNKFDAQQEPVAVIGNWGRVEWAEGVFPQLGDKMYAAPPKQWVGLTDEERDKIILGRQQRWEIAHMIEAALRSKNSI